MRRLNIVLSLYLIWAAFFVVTSSIRSIAILSTGKLVQPPTTLDFLITIFLTIPLFILGVIVIRFNGVRTNKKVVSTDLDDRLSVPAGNKNDRQRAYEFIKREIVSLKGSIRQGVDEIVALQAALGGKLELGDVLRGLKDGILDPTPKLIEAFKSLVGPKVDESQIYDVLIRPFLI